MNTIIMAYYIHFYHQKMKKAAYAVIMIFMISSQLNDNMK